MKTRNVKLVAVLLIICLALGLSGCGKPAVDQSKEVNLVWWVYGDKPKDADLVVAEINKYIKPKINATVDIQWTSYDGTVFTNKMNLLSSAGDKYDLVFTASWVNSFQLGAQKGFFMPLDDLLAKYGQGVKKAVDPMFWDGTIIKGNHYAVPTNKEVAVEARYSFNMNLLKKAGMDSSVFKTIKSLADLEPIFAKMHKADPNVYCYSNWDKFREYDIIIDYNIPGAVRVDDPNCRVINQFEDAPFIAVLKQMRKFYQEGYVSKSEKDAPLQLFTQGKLLCAAFDNNPYIDLERSRDLGFPIESAPAYPPIATVNSVAGAMTAISATSENPERAMALLNLVNTDPVLRNMFSYGVEGVHFNKVGATEIEFTARHGDYSPPHWLFGNFFILYTVKGDPADKWEKFREFNASVKKSPIFGFFFDGEPVRSELSALQNIGNEFAPTLFRGSVDVDEAVRNFADKAKGAGLDKVLAEMQKQIDAWRAAK